MESDTVKNIILIIFKNQNIAVSQSRNIHLRITTLGVEVTSIGFHTYWERCETVEVIDVPSEIINKDVTCV